MENNNKKLKRKHVFWIYTGVIESSLDAATWLETTKHLRSLGWQVTLITVGNKGKCYHRNVEIMCLPMPGVYLLGQMLFHISVIKQLYRQWGDIDIVLFHEISALWLLPLRILVSFQNKVGRPQFVMDTRTLFMQPEKNNSIRDKIRFYYYRIMAKMANKYGDGRLAITNEMAKACNVPKVKLWGVWPSGVDLDPFISIRKKRKWPVLDQPIKIIYIGSLHYERNLLTFCRAVDKVNQQYKRFEFLLYGEGTQEKELMYYAQNNSKSIKIFPPIPHEEVPALLTEAHVGVLPFPDEEKFRVSSPIKLFEYMASGMPILATKILCHTNVIKNGDSVFWAEQSTQESLVIALEKMWEKRHQLSSMGEASINVARTWTWINAANKLSDSLIKGLDMKTLTINQKI